MTLKNMTFKEYRESGMFLEDIRNYSSQKVTGLSLHEYKCVPYYVNLKGYPMGQGTLFSISCYFTSLLLQAVGRLYGYKYMLLCCRACHWPFFCVGYGNEVSPIEILKSDDLLPLPCMVRKYVRRLDEARDYFVEDFMTLFTPGVWSPEPEALRELQQRVDVPILRKEIYRQVDFFRSWLYNRSASYEYSYVHPRLSLAVGHPLGKRDNLFPKEHSLCVQSYVTLHSKYYQKDLDELSLSIGDLGFHSSHRLPEEAFLDLNRDFLAGRPVRIVGNRIAFNTLPGFFKDEAAAARMLRDPVLHGKYHFDASHDSMDGKYSFRVWPDSFAVELIRAQSDDFYDIALVRFESEIKIETPVPLIPLNQLVSPFGFGGDSKMSRMMAFRALLEYGDKVKIVHPTNYSSQVVKVPETEEELEKSLFFSYFKGRDVTPDRIIELLEDVGEVRRPTRNDPVVDFIMKETHHCVWGKIVRDFGRALEGLRKCVEEMKPSQDVTRNILVYFRPRPFGGFVKTPRCESVEECTNVIGYLEQWVCIVQKTIEIIENKLIPLEPEMRRPYVKRRRSLVSRTLAHYIFQKIQADPLSFTESKNPSIQECARRLVAGM